MECNGLYQKIWGEWTKSQQGLILTIVLLHCQKLSIYEGPSCLEFCVPRIVGIFDLGALITFSFSAL